MRAVPIVSSNFAQPLARNYSRWILAALSRGYKRNNKRVLLSDRVSASKIIRRPYFDFFSELRIALAGLLLLASS